MPVAVRLDRRAASVEDREVPALAEQRPLPIDVQPGRPPGLGEVTHPELVPR